MKKKLCPSPCLVFLPSPSLARFRNGRPGRKPPSPLIRRPSRSDRCRDLLQLQKLHDLLLQSTSNDTALVKAVRYIYGSIFARKIHVHGVGHRPTEPRVLQAAAMHRGARSDHWKLPGASGMSLISRPCTDSLTCHLKVRQLAAVELRKRVSQNSGNLWTLLDQSSRQEIKTQLPNLILNESK